MLKGHLGSALLLPTHFTGSENLSPQSGLQRCARVASCLLHVCSPGEHSNLTKVLLRLFVHPEYEQELIFVNFFNISMLDHSNNHRERRARCYLLLKLSEELHGY